MVKILYSYNKYKVMIPSTSSINENITYKNIYSLHIYILSKKLVFTSCAHKCALVPTHNHYVHVFNEYPMCNGTQSGTAKCYQSAASEKISTNCPAQEMRRT